MRIVLPGALPDPRAAAELIPHVQKAAPTLLRWLEQSHARCRAADPATTACTPYEQWRLTAHGFKPETGQTLASGLGPLLAPNTAAAHEPVWVVELVHVSPSRDGAALLPAAELRITQDQSVALFESVQEMFAQSGFSLHRTGTERWSINLPPDCMPTSASPALVSISSVNEWWPQDLAARSWRRLVNEVQMLWFEHPVNQERFQADQMPINSLWLFGGARTEQITDLSALDTTQVHNQLLAPCVAQDWGAWLAQLENLESEIFKPLAARVPDQLVLTGSDRIAELSPSALSRWTRWLPGKQNTWRKWWSSQP